MSENNVNGITGADVATTTGIVGATVAIGQYIINDYVITIAEAEGDYGYTMTITRGTDTQTVTLYGLTPEQYASMLGYLEQAQEAAQSAEGSASDASVRAISASDAANRALNFTLRAERACDSARSYETQAKTAKQDAETAKTQAQDYKQAAEAAATRAETAAEEITGMTAEAETLEPGSPATASFLDGVLSLGIPAGANGADGNGIVSIIKTGTSGNVDTYTITYTNGTTSTFTVRNGVDGAVTSVAGKTGAVTLNAGDVAFDDQQAYNDGTVGAGLTNLKSQMDDLQTDVDVLVKNAIDSPDVLQKIVAAGHISNYLDIGDVITIPWTDNGGNTPVTYQYPFVVVNIADVYDSNNIKHENALWLMAMYVTPRDISFDAAESTQVDLTQEPNALEGWYYWGVNGATYTAHNLSTGDPIPTSYTSVVKCGINDVSVLCYGYNRWKDSAYRQWLNSDAEKNEGWWTAQHMGDVPPEAVQTNLPGWLDGFMEDWLAIFKPVKVDTACNTVTDGGVTDTTYDTFFLPSVEQMYGTPQAAGVEGDYWPYWKEETGLDAPTNGSSSNTNDVRKIPSIASPTSGSVISRLRSAYQSTSNGIWAVLAGGYLNTGYGAFNAYRALPSCVIY